MNAGGILRQLLSSYLLIWIPGTFAVELLNAFPSLGIRGPAAAVEVAVHGLIAMWCAVAGRMLRLGSPSAPLFAAVGIGLRAAASLQALMWSSLPQNTAPGARLPLVLFTCATAGFWLIVIRRVSRP